jgi:hypothetical protein
MNATPSDLPPIGAPATRALESIGVTRLEQLGQYRDADLLDLHGFGPRALDLVREALARNNPPPQASTNDPTHRARSTSPSPPHSDASATTTPGSA